MICVGRKYAHKELPENFSGNLRKFGQKSFAPQDFACSYTEPLPENHQNGGFTFVRRGLTFVQGGPGIKI